MLLNSLQSGSPAFDCWLDCGGREVLACYGVGEAVEELRSAIPARHVQFLQLNCLPYFETPTHIFVHAGVDREVPLAEQSDWTLFWQFWNDPPRHISGKQVICGHSAQESGWPVANGNAVCIDTDACAGQWLTALDVETGQFWQANQSGRTRRGHLNDLPLKT